MADSKGSGDANVEHFLFSLYKEVATERRWSGELSDIVSATKEMVKRIVNEAVSPCKDTLRSEGLIDINVTEAGSMADGTSICDPDEFDFTMEFTYSSEVISTQPSSSLRDISFPKNTIKPKDPRYRQIFLGNNMVQPYLFTANNFLRLENAIGKVRNSGAVKLGKNSLHLCVPDGKKSYYGMQGPAFHLHNLLKWCSESRSNDLLISVDLVPAIQLSDKSVYANVPLFKQECQCKEHDLGQPERYLLLPLNYREHVTNKLIHYSSDSDEHREAKEQFLQSYFMVSLSEYENNIMKQWKCEKSIYHNWYICYTLMKCFGKVDHDCGGRTVTFKDGKSELTHYGRSSYPERNDSFSSYSWKTMVFTKAQKKGKDCLTVKSCFDCLTSVFEKENLEKSQVVTIDSFWCPSVIAETILLRKKDNDYTEYVKSMIGLKSMLKEISVDPNYTYKEYRKQLLEDFPDLSAHLPTDKSSSPKVKSNM